VPLKRIQRRECDCVYCHNGFATSLFLVIAFVIVGFVNVAFVYIVINGFFFIQLLLLNFFFFFFVVVFGDIVAVVELVDINVIAVQCVGVSVATVQYVRGNTAFVRITAGTGAHYRFGDVDVSAVVWGVCDVHQRYVKPSDPERCVGCGGGHCCHCWTRSHGG
jgi:hypothetical protein